MSATYKLIGKRWLRKYTAANVTPVYAAESEVAKLANSLCDVAWKSVSPKDAQMSYHTDNVVAYSDPSDDTTGIKGLDYNVQIRDSFDAALFCGYHVNETHRVYGNAACYKYILPDMASYPTLESLKVNVTSDPYNSTGARIAIFTNSTGVIPTACSDCRQGSAPLSTGHSCTQAEDTNDWTTNDTYAEAVCPREARTTTTGTGSKATTSTSWYPVRGTCTFNMATPLQLCKYVYVFVLLENYNVCRGNWIEGCSFIDNLVEMTTSSAVSAWDTRVSGGETELDVGDESGGTAGGAPSGVDILKSSGFTNVVGSGRKYAVAEAPLCGVEEPARQTYLGVSSTVRHPGLWYNGSPSSMGHSFSGKIVGCSPMSLSYLMVTTADQTLPSGTTGQMWAGGIVATYDPSNDGTGQMPGLSFCAAVYDAYGAGTAYDVVQLAPSFASNDLVPEGAKDMLVSGTVKRIFVVPVLAWYNASSIPSNKAQIDRTAFLIVLASDDRTEILGHLVCKYRSCATIESAWSMYAATNSDSFGEYGLVCCAAMHSRLRTFINVSSVVGTYCTANGVTFDDTAGTLTYASDSILPSTKLFYAWRLTVDDTNVLVQSNKAGVIGCYGENISVEPAGPFGSVAGHTAYSTVVVCGNLSRVGTTECENVAYIDMYPSADGTATEGIVSVPSYDSLVTPVKYDKSFRVFPACYPSSGGDTALGVDAFVTSQTGILIGSSIVNAATVTGSTLAAAASPLNYNLAFVHVPEKFQCVLAAFTSYSMVMYGTTAADTILQTSSPASAAIGLRNCVGRMYDGKSVEILSADSVGQKANFTVTPTTKSLLLTSDYGLTSNAVAFPIWRICTSYVLVPFTMPLAESFTASLLKLSWNALANCTEGSMLNVWVRKGSRVSDDESTLRDLRLYSAQTSTVGNWTLLGRIPAYGATSGEIDISGKMDPGTCNTLLLTAWCPYDTYNPSGSSLPTRLGVGILDVNPVSGEIVGAETSGWRPDITLM